MTPHLETSSEIQSFRVTTAQTVYEQYLVEAKSAEEARTIICDPAQRSRWPSAEIGGNDDEDVIDVTGVAA